MWGCIYCINLCPLAPQVPESVSWSPACANNSAVLVISWPVRCRVKNMVSPICCGICLKWSLSPGRDEVEGGDKKMWVTLVPVPIYSIIVYSLSIQLSNSNNVPIWFHQSRSVIERFWPSLAQKKITFGRLLAHLKAFPLERHCQCRDSIAEVCIVSCIISWHWFGVFLRSQDSQYHLAVARRYFCHFRSDHFWSAELYEQVTVVSVGPCRMKSTMSTLLHAKVTCDGSTAGVALAQHNYR